MAQQITFRIYKNDEHRGTIEWADGDSVVVGRQLTPKEPRYQLNEGENGQRIAFAKNQDAMYSRNHLKLEKTPDAKLVITNTANSEMPVFVNPSTELRPSQSVERMLPTTISLRDYSIRIERSLKSLSRQTRFLKEFDSAGSGIYTPVIPQDDKATVEQIAGMIQQLSLANSILQQANSREDLYQKAIDAVKSLIDMDGVAIINADNVNDIYTPDDISPSLSAIEGVRSSKQVRWTPPDQQIDTSESQRDLECFIAAPIVRPQENEERVAAILYAHRSLSSNFKPDDSGQRQPRQPLSEIIAQIFELIACSVAAGLVRIQNQNTESLFNQFFSEKLANKLLQSQTILEPCEREVTVMFCDIRKFSSISEKLGPSLTSRWVQSVMTQLSECVHEFDGVVVDYIGDELMAMWGAPDDLSDHATLACRCANRMIERLPQIDDQWREIIGQETQFGIGINSGKANVGNIGSEQRFKYGPLGNTVNQASRVQGLTKFLKVNAILTNATKEKLTDTFQLRRLGKARVVNIEESIELFELCPEISDGMDSKYEEALSDLEQGELATAAQILKSMDFKSPDHPALLILQEIINRVINERQSGEFEWEFDSK